MKKFMQLKEYLLEMAFIALLVRVAAVGCGIGEALAMISVVSSMGYNKWLAKAKIEQYEELNNKINTENEALRSQINAEFNKLIEANKDLTARISSLAMDKSIRRMNESQTQSPAGLTTTGNIEGPTGTLGTPKRYF